MNPMTPLATALLADLDTYASADAQERALLTRIRDFVRASASAFSRANPHGHITASAVLVQPEGSAFVLRWHRKLGRWLQPGGHMEEADESVFAAALREAREETGIERFAFPTGDLILDMDVHPIPAYGPDPAHFHYDIRYLLTVPESLPPLPEDCALFTFEQALAAGMDDSLARALRKARSRIVHRPSSIP